MKNKSINKQGSIIFQKDGKKALQISILAAMFICIIGFGVLNVCWIFTDKSTGLRGFYEFYAATIGDGICLPMVVASGTYYILVNGIERKDLGKIRIAAMIALLAGVAIQASWLIRDNTILNWTIPRMHHFNFAGWWHAFYFVGMLALITAVVTAAILIGTRKTRNIPIYGKYSYSLMWIAGIAYWHTHMMDDYMTKDNFLFFLLLTSAVMSILFVVAEIFSKRSLNWRELGVAVIGEVLLFIVICIYYSRF